MADLLLIGATGAVGQAVLARALADPRVTRLIAPTRRPLPPQPRLENPVVDFEALPADAPWWQVDGVICTLGTTMRVAKTRTAFRKVDFDYPLAAARLALARGARAFALTSSVGASARSPSFYLRTKGEVEQALIALAYPSLTIVRPASIDAPRSPARRVEVISTALLRVLTPIVPRRFRAVTPDQIADMLIRSALDAPAGARIIESEVL